MSEDCLFLTIWTPSARPAAPRPVMVWLHGGGFNAGSGSSPPTDGSALARDHDVVVVAINHRLGALGYLRLDAVSGGRINDSANVGTRDQALALRWVRNNIEAFGGDPHNVTIFGESGGGWKVSVLLGSPLAAGLFHHAVIQSGPCLEVCEPAAADAVAERLLAELGLAKDSVEGIFDLPTERIVEAQTRVQMALGPAVIPNFLRGFAPSIEPELMPRHPFHPDASPISRDVDVMVGWNRTEMTLFAPLADLEADEGRMVSKVEALAGEDAHELIGRYRARAPEASPAQLWAFIQSDLTMVPFAPQIAQRHAALGAGGSYVYRFDWRTPALDGKLMSPHALEIPFVFGTLAATDELAGPGDPDLSRDMMRAWTAFASTGNPNHPESSLPDWPTFSSENRAIMLLDSRSTVDPDPYADVRDLLEGIATRLGQRQGLG
jgi:para-nitrobenzyl esterase